MLAGGLVDLRDDWCKIFMWSDTVRNCEHSTLDKRYSARRLREVSIAGHHPCHTTMFTDNCGANIASRTQS